MKIIISLTTIKSRITYLKYVVYSLLNQTVQPDNIIIYYQGCIDDLNILNLKNSKITIRCINTDYRSYSKYHYSIKEFNDDIIILCDDDIIYNKFYIENLIYQHKINNNYLLCNCFNYLHLKDNKILCDGRPDTKYLMCNKIRPLSGWGTLIPPNFFDMNFYDDHIKYFIDNFYYDDEFFLYYNCLYLKKDIVCIGKYKNPFYKSIAIKNKMFDDCLYHKNIIEQYKYGDLFYKIISNEYPNIFGLK